MKINVSIEARMTSSRLPGKVLKKLGSSSVLGIMVNRINRCKLVNNIIVATTTNKEDDPVVEFCKEVGIKYFRGSESNVFKRVLNAHQENNTDIIVELTGDCPFIDPILIDDAIQFYLDNDYDYVSNSVKMTYPIGMAIQVYSLKALEKVAQKQLSDMDKEHVTPEFYTSGKYSIYNIEAPKHLHYPQLSVTLDTKEDYEVISSIINSFKRDDFSLEEIIEFAKNNTDIVNINKDIHRKGLS